MAMACSDQVRVLGTTYIPFLHPPPPHLERVTLSFFDAWFLPQPPIQRLFLYDGGADVPAFPSLLRSLKSSLADAITTYFPLAGKLTYLPSRGDVVVDCSPTAVGEGVAFYEAEADGDVCRLSGREAHDVPAFLRFVPRLDTPELPAKALAVQVTRFEGGGVAVGVTVHHAVADGQSFWRFMGAWAAACRRAPFPESPTFDRSVIVHPRAGEMARGILRRVAHDLPQLPTANVLRSTWMHHDTTTLVLQSGRIDELKNIITQLNDHSRPSTFVAIASLVWTAIVQARSLNHDDLTHLLFLANCRSRLRPPVDESYFGNCVKGCIVEAAVGDLSGGNNNSFLRASAAIQKAIGEFVDQPLAECDAWFEPINGLIGRPGFVAVTASPQFEVYGTDFGWGKPRRVEFVSESTPEGMVVLTAGPEEGSVQMSVSLNPMHMQAFRLQVLNF